MLPSDLVKYKEKSRKIIALTAWDSISGSIAEQANADLVLVGDSLAMVCLGYKSTLPLTLENIIYHTNAVSRGFKKKLEEQPLIVCDMPFLTVALVERLLEVEHSAVFAESEKMAGFPFCLSKRVLPSVEECIEGGELSVQAFASRHGYRVRIPRCDWPQLTNINTPAQLAAARAALK